MIKKMFLLLLYLCFAFLLFSERVSINNYKKCIYILKNDKESFIAIRVFYENGIKKFFAVDPSTLQTLIVRKGGYTVKGETFESINIIYKNSVYIRALKEVNKTKDMMCNAGFICLNAPADFCFLTVDLCPSSKPLDRYLFEDLLKRQHGQNEIPAGISITGGWIKKHIDDLEYLKKLHENKSYNILWINHTYTHHYKKDVPLNKNFMLTEGINQINEILKNEKLMLENKIVPSVFFRFPGLVSDKILFEKVLSLGLIPLGSNGWAAKGQKPVTGSIVLVHGNGNEEIGIKKFFDYLSENKNLKFSGIIENIIKMFE